MSIYSDANTNMMSRFRDNPCRGLVVGEDANGNLVQLSWIMGRSEGSQNRVYVFEDNILRTKAFDESKVDDPSLIIYTAMLKNEYGMHVVGNGSQTEAVSRYNQWSKSNWKSCLVSGQSVYTCEPDAPTFTPRITGALLNDDENPEPVGVISVLSADKYAKEVWKEAMHKFPKKLADFEKPGMRKSEVLQAYIRAVGNKCCLVPHKFPTVRRYYDFPLQRGFGYCVTTYMPGSKELSSFEGEPFIVPLQRTLEDTVDSFWERLEPQWRVAIAGKQIMGDDTDLVVIRNRHA